MTMLSHVSDLLVHMEWADAAHWRTILAHPPALDDRVLLERLHHIHLVQHFFCSVVSATPFAMTHPADFPTIDGLRQYGRDGLAALVALAGSLDEATVARPITIPWFKDPPLEITAAQALTQAALHTQHHRGQNAVRLRELGAEPPTTDLIVWWWKGRPAPAWD